MRVTKTFEKDSVSNNVLLYWKHKQPWYYTKEKKEWENQLIVLKAPMGPAKGKRYLKITRYCVKRYDEDNFRGGLKPLYDAMKNIRLIVEDNPNWLSKNVKQIRKPGKPHLEITIEDVTPENELVTLTLKRVSVQNLVNCLHAKGTDVATKGNFWEAIQEVEKQLDEQS